MLLKGPSELLDIAEFILGLLEVGYVKANFKYTKKDEYSECHLNRDGSFTILIESDLECEKATVRHMAHEITHLKQFKRDELRNDEYGVFWKGELYHMGEHCSDEYFLSPWEMEARALEDWILYRWESK